MGHPKRFTLKLLFVSIPVHPDNTAIEAVLNNISANVRIVWGFDNQNKQWQKYKGQGSSSTGQGQNTLTAMEAGKGYWIYMNSAASLTIAGVQPSTIQPLNLFAGWNLVGYSGTDNKDITQGLGTGLDGKWTIVWNWAGGVWKAKKAQGIEVTILSPELATLNKGRAYWIKMNTEASW